MIKIIIHLFSGRLTLDTGVLGIPIFFGLIYLRNRWRVFALVLLWLGIILTPIIFIIGLMGGVPATFDLFGLPAARVSGWFVSLGSIPIFLLLLWEYRVLTRPDIRRLFVQRSPHPNA